ncbi:MAG: hypothetical protein QGF59_06485 [Pirellulaceae bacterium]|nr:hypothetical protein [Pirellulaceae bacterium]MDP6718279.1 hypothetical protein [Pirellulaceae bacterium]
MSYLRHCVKNACFVALLLTVTSVSADEASTNRGSANKIDRRQPTRFIRVRYDEFKSPVALQTASAKYVLPGPNGKNQLEVVLEGVIHVGDRSYYREFNRRFRHYDAVLYELIAPPEKLIPNPNDERPHPLRILQQVSAEGLGFASQIDEIDYEAPNMVHSDLSPAELARITKGRGEDQVTMLLEIFTDILRKRNIKDDDTPDAQDDGDSPSDSERSDGDEASEMQDDSDSPDDSEPSDNETDDTDDDNQPSLALSLRLLSDPDGAVKIRRLLATGFDKSPSLEAMLRPSQLATLIDARNARALEVLQEQLDDGQRRIALFWGAGHMADFERQLVLTYSVQPAGIVWRDAWDLRDGAVEFSPLESILEKSLRGSLKDAVKGLLRNEP